MTDAPEPGGSYSTRQLALRAGVSLQTVQRWVDAGLIRAWRTPGGHRRLDVASAEDFLRSLDAPPAPVAAPAQPPAASPADAAAAPLKLLLVDDDPQQRSALTWWAQAALPDAHIVTALDGGEALIAVGQHEPDIVVTDILMPQLDGHQLIQLLQTNTRVRPPIIIAISGATQQQLAAMGKLPATVPVLYRPFEMERLAELLRAAQATLRQRGGE